MTAILQELGELVVIIIVIIIIIIIIKKSTTITITITTGGDWESIYENDQSDKVL